MPRIGLFPLTPMIGALSPEDQAAVRRSALLQASLGMLEASGPSRMPVSLGQVLARGAQQGLGAADIYARSALEAEEAKRVKGERAGKTAAVRAIPAGGFQTAADVMRWAQQFPGMEDVAIGAAQPPKPVEVSPGARIIDPRTGRVIADAPHKPSEQPANVEAYEYAVRNGFKGTFMDFLQQSVLAKTQGELQAQAIVNLPTVISNAEVAKSLIERALNHPGRRAATGLDWARGAVPGTQAYDFAQLIEQLKSRTFLEAFAALRGGGQISNIEGIKAETAIANLNRAQSEDAFVRALQDLADVVDRGLANAKAKAAGSPAPTGGAAPTMRFDAQGNRIP